VLRISAFSRVEGSIVFDRNEREPAERALFRRSEISRNYAVFTRRCVLARQEERTALDTCEESPSGELLRALGEFNRGDWFECHETLEELWAGASGNIRDFFQGTLQIAVALHHWRNGNFKGAILLLASGAEYLRRAGPVCQRVDVSQLLASAGRLEDALQALGPARMAELDPDLVPRMRLVGARKD